MEDCVAAAVVVFVVVDFLVAVALVAVFAVVGFHVKLVAAVVSVPLVDAPGTNTSSISQPLFSS